MSKLLLEVESGAVPLEVGRNKVQSANLGGVAKCPPESSWSIFTYCQSGLHESLQRLLCKICGYSTLRRHYLRLTARVVAQLPGIGTRLAVLVERSLRHTSAIYRLRTRMGELEWQ